MPMGFDSNCSTCMSWVGDPWARPENTREIIHHDDGTHTLIKLDGTEIILGPGPTLTPEPEPEPGLVPVEQALPPLLEPLDWTIDDDDDTLEGGRQYWENSKVRRLMGGDDFGQD